jgi:hypothetical protein
MEDFIMYEKYLEQLEEAGKSVTLKNVPSTAIKTMSLIFWNIRIRILKSLPVRMSGLFCLQKKRKGNGRNWPFLVLNLYGVFWCMCHPDVLSGSGIMGFYVPAANTKSSLYAGISSDAKNIFQSSGIRRCQKYWNSYTG